VTTIAFHKPYGVLSRFTPDGSAWQTLAGFGLPPAVWPIGRLDADSEGLLILSADKRLVDRLLAPGRGHGKTYWVQIERLPTDAALAELASGVEIAGGTDPAGAGAAHRGAGATAARPADPLPQDRARLLDRADDHRGAQPSGAQDDRRGRPSDPAAGAGRDRSLRAGRAGAGRVPGAGGRRTSRR
jgi:hypothetical protein